MDTAERLLRETTMRRVERLHSLLELLAGRFRGYLPWPQELRDSVVRGHEMAIDDTLKKADEIMRSLSSTESKESAAGPERAGSPRTEDASAPPAPTAQSETPEMVIGDDAIIHCLIAWLNGESREGRFSFTRGQSIEALQRVLDSRSLLAQRDEGMRGFRDTVLNQRGALAENGMTNDQINDVLREFDAAEAALQRGK